MGTVAPFRIKGGINLDGKVEFQVFNSAPSGVKADKMGVGSLAVASDTGKWYRKTTFGAGPDKWSKLLDANSAEGGGGAVHWKHPVRLSDHRALTTAQYVTALNQFGHLGGENPRSDIEVLWNENNMHEFAALLTQIDDPDSNPGRFIITQGFARLAWGYTGVYFRANTSGPSGNDITLEFTINNPANATSTTCTLVGTAFTVNLKNNGTNPTATVGEALDAIEAVDVNNLIYPMHVGGDSRPNSAEVMVLTNLAGGKMGNEVGVQAGGEIGTADTNRIRFDAKWKGTGWNNTVITLTTNGLDGRTTTQAVYSFTANTLTVNLKNDGVAVTETIDGLMAAMDNLVDSWVDENGSMLYNRVIYVSIPDATPGTALVPTYSGTPMSGGEDMDWDIMPGFGLNVGSDTAVVDYGDTVYIERGQDMGALYIYNDEGEWVKQGKADATEVGFLRAFVGKGANGNVAPNYSSTDVVTQGNNLTGAVSELDAAAGDLLAFAGATEGVAAPTYGTTNAVTQGASLKDAVGQLDLEAGYLLAFIGKAKGNEAPAYTTTKVVGQGTSLETAVSALDDLLGAAKEEGKSSNVTTQMVVDSFLMEQNLAAEWIVHVREVANPGNVYVTKVLAAHNADVGVAATQADFAESAILELGSPIDGFSISMDVEVAGALNARTMRLLMASTDAVDVTMSREVLRRQP